MTPEELKEVQNSSDKWLWKKIGDATLEHQFAKKEIYILEIERRNAEKIKISVDKFSKSSTFFALILTGLAVVQLFVLFKFQLPLIKLESQLHIQGVIDGCKTNSEIKWIDPDGNLHPCSDIPESWIKK